MKGRVFPRFCIMLFVLVPPSHSRMGFCGSPPRIFNASMNVSDETIIVVGRTDHFVFLTASGLVLLAILFMLQPVPLTGLQYSYTVSYLTFLMHNRTRHTEHYLLPGLHINHHVEVKSPAPLSDDLSTVFTSYYVLLRWRIWLDEHLAKVFQLLRATDFLSEQRKLDDVEEFIVKFMGFVQVFLLHLMTHIAMLAVGC